MFRAMKAWRQQNKIDGIRANLVLHEAELARAAPRRHRARVRAAVAAAERADGRAPPSRAAGPAARTQIQSAWAHGYHKTDRQGRPMYIDSIGAADLDALFKARRRRAPPPCPRRGAA